MATEKQAAALARARAAKAAKAAVTIGLSEIPFHDPTGEAFVAESEQPMPAQIPVLDPEIATPPKYLTTDEFPLVAAARKMLASVEVKRGDGVLMDDRCQLCEDTGVHHTVPYRCGCGCHALREALRLS